MQALVLAAGLGTRLRPLTNIRAKPALPVANQAMIRRILAWLGQQGARDIVVNLHHLPETLTAVAGDGGDLGVRVRYSWEYPEVLGSAGGPRQALSLLDAETFLIVNGDTLTDVDLRSLEAAHARSTALVTLALVPNADPARYGGVRLDAAGRVAGFARKGESQGSFHFVGVQIASADAFRGLTAGVPVNSVGGLYDSLIARNPDALRGFVCDAAFWDVGTPWDYWLTCRAFAAAEGLGDTLAGRDTRIDPAARVTRAILWDRVEIGPRAIVDECIVTDDVTISAGSMYRRSIVMRGTGPDDLVVSPLSP